MNNLKIFESKEFGSVRVIESDDGPWFVGKDVAGILGYTNPQKAVRDHVDGEDRREERFVTPSGDQKGAVINESGVYSLILSSKLPQAKAFKRWITTEVLPAIRKTGGYIHGAEELSDTEIVARALQISQKIIDDRNRRIGELEVQNSALTVSNQVMQPKADYFDQLVDRNLLTNFRETAKQLQIPERQFISFLLAKKYIYRDKKGKLMPYAAKNAGLFELKECMNEKTHWSGTQTLVTPKGRETFRLLWEAEPGK